MKLRGMGVALGIAAVLVPSYLYLFREAAVVTPRRIRMTYHWRWGALREVEIDLNLDGLTDFRGVYPGWSPDRSVDDAYETGFASSKCDGTFDVRLEYGNGWDVRRILVDVDRDGEWETALDLTAGVEFLVGGCEHWREWLPQEDRMSPLRGSG